MQYYSLITEHGLNRQIQALNSGQTIKLTKMAVGSGDGEISQSQTTLQEQKYEFFINSIEVDENNKNQLIATGVIPSNIGGFYIKEVGVFDDSGSLFAIGKIAPTYKPLLSEGSAKDLTIKFYLQVENVSNIELKIDPSVVIATRKWTLDNLNKKADKLNVFTKLQSDERYIKKDALPSYTKQEVDSLLKNKRDNDETANDVGQPTFKKFLIDLFDCDPNTYFPCVSSSIPPFERTTFKIICGPHVNNKSKVDWITHSGGFAMFVEWNTNGNNWGWAEIVRNIKRVRWAFTENNQSPILKIDQVGEKSQEYFYLRGGGRYEVHVDRGVQISMYKKSADIVISGETKKTLPPIKYDALLVPEETQRSLIPAGTIIQSASQATPQGYLKCNGASISRSDYQKLFGIIGTTFGSDDENTFKLPDLRGRFVRGFSDGSSIDSGRAFGSSQEDDLKRHTHAFALSYPGTDPYVKGTYEVLQNKTYNPFNARRDDVLGDEAMVKYKDTKNTPKGMEMRGDLAYEGNSDEVRVKNIALNFYIKY